MCIVRLSHHETNLLFIVQLFIQHHFYRCYIISRPAYDTNNCYSRIKMKDLV